MGCAPSSSARVIAASAAELGFDGSALGDAAYGDACKSGGVLSKADVRRRLTVAPTRRVEGVAPGLSLVVAALSQRGYYPEALTKPNQDAFVCSAEPLERGGGGGGGGGGMARYAFGVFDGHGATGDLCARFCRDNVPSLLARGLADSAAGTGHDGHDAASGSGGGSSGSGHGGSSGGSHGDASSSSPSSVAAVYGADRALRYACTEANSRLRGAPINDRMSGSTAIVCLFEGAELHVANVGDSRAIIVSEAVEGGGGHGGHGGGYGGEAAHHQQQRAMRGDGGVALRAAPLSVDHTPYRADERERVKRHGARVRTMDQLEGIEPVHENWGGNGGGGGSGGSGGNGDGDGDGDGNSGGGGNSGDDPPRVWSASGNFPGVAFTRSIGDAVAEGLGVTAEPEIEHRPLHGGDRWVLLASDGVFEFLSSAAVADMVSGYG